jgi:hypothetical protein
MDNLDLTMQVLATLALLMYLAPRVIGGKLGLTLPKLAMATLAVAIILALVQTYFWFAR